MLVVGMAFTGRHAVVFSFPVLRSIQVLSFQGSISLLSSGSLPIPPTVFLLLVELVHADDVVFREDFSGYLGKRASSCLVVICSSSSACTPIETVLPMVEVIVTLSQIEIDDADGVNLLDVSIALA